MNQKKILIIEDDYAIIRGLKDSFIRNKFTVETAMDGQSAIDCAINMYPDIIILDIMLPIIDGFEVCQTLRNAGLECPIIMLTARGDEQDIVRGLNCGADDYIAKPFSIVELHARVNAFIRRYNPKVISKIKIGDWQYHPDEHYLKDDTGKKQNLTPKENALLKLLIKKEGRALTREHILNAVWHSEILAMRRSVDRCITTLRKKLEHDPKNPKHIISMRDIGYKFLLHHTKND